MSKIKKKMKKKILFLIKKVINKTFPNIKPSYHFNFLTKHYEVYFHHSNKTYILVILEDSKCVHIKKNIYILKKLHLQNYIKIVSLNV